MRFTTGLKKFLSLALTGALVITGAAIDAGTQNKTAQAAKKAVFDGEVTWNYGENADCRLELYNSWGATPTITDGVLDTEFTELEVTFDVAGVKEALEKAKTEPTL